MRTRVLFVALTLATAACASATTDASTVPTTLPGTTTTTTTATTTTAPSPTEIPPSIDWENPQNPVAVGVGWVIARCEGEAPLLCISRDGDIVGVVEWFVADPFTYDVYDPEADEEANLRAIAADFIDSFVADRAAGCGADYAVDPTRSGAARVWWRDRARLWVPGNDERRHTFGAASAVPDLLQGQADPVDGKRLRRERMPRRGGLATFDSAGLEALRPHLELLLALSPLPGGDPESGHALPDGSTFVWMLADDDHGFVRSPGPTRPAAAKTRPLRTPKPSMSRARPRSHHVSVSGGRSALRPAAVCFPAASRRSSSGVEQRTRNA
jgi:hypothetical protein